MFLARVINSQTQVYPLIEQRVPRAWRFVSYGKGAAAIAETELQAVVMARRELARPAMARLRHVAEQSKRVA